MDIFVPNRRTNPHKGLSAWDASGSEASDTKVSRSAARKGRLPSIQARSSEKTMMRHRPMRRSRHNGVSAFHDHVSALLKKAGGLKGKTPEQRRKMMADASRKAKAAVDAGKPAPKGAKGDYAARTAAAVVKYKSSRARRGGKSAKAFKALPVEERAALLVASGAKVSKKTAKNKKVMYRIGNMLVNEALYNKFKGKSKSKSKTTVAPAVVAAPAAAGKFTGTKTASNGQKMFFVDGKRVKEAAYKAAVGSKSKSKSKSTAKKVAAAPAAGKFTGTKTASNGQKMFFVDGKRVKEEAYKAAKGSSKSKSKSKARPAPVAATAGGRKKKANPNFAMVLDGTKQFGRDFFTLQSVGGAAVVGLAHGFVAPMVAEKLNEYVPQRVTIPGLNVEVGASDFAFTATGLVAGALLGGLGYAMGRPNLGLGLGLLAAGSGVVIDTVGLVMGARSGSQMGAIDDNGNVYGDVAYGDVAYGAIDANGNVYGAIDNEGTVYGDVAYGGVYAGGTMDYGTACAAQYSDAMAGDAQYSGADFSAAEGQALMDGPGAWMKRFGKPATRATGVRSSVSRHAGKEGHRWGWLIKLVGMEKAKQIAALPPEKRLAVIDGLRKQAVSSLANLMATQAAGTTQQTELTTAMASAPKQNLLPAPEQAGLDLTGAAGGAMAGGGALSYGTVMYAGGGF